MRRKIVLGSAAFIVAMAALVAYPKRYDLLSRQASINPLELEGQFDPGGDSGIFNNRPVKIHGADLKESQGEAEILGWIYGPKRIEIDLASQRLYAYEGNRQVYNFLVSTGKWGRTPTGVFRIWTKLRYTTMAGGSKALGTYYYLPNVPYTMYFYNEEISQSRGYGVHGTYWHDNFGQPMSHGCINLKTEEAAQLYDWANPELRGQESIRSTRDNPGTPIIIYGTAPDE